ncbi:MAG: hypothetical protein K0Q93_3153 [Nocardioidaceae bacterium]|jgi:hypothetical protein|nr:hypothetical protein [Nocardioidaceae bacterium]
MTSLINWLRCLRLGHEWVRPSYHGHLISLGTPLAEVLAMPACKGECVRCGKWDCPS